MGKTAVAVAGLALALAASGGRLRGQELRGTVRDSASRLPIPGAVVTLLDSAAGTLARTITNERGQYRVVLLGPGVRALRVVRLGFRPTTTTLPDPRDGVVRGDVVMVAIPMALQSVQISASPSCPRRRDRALALALLEQARAGLLATVVARSDNPAHMMRLRAVRTMDGNSNRIVHQRVRIDSAGVTLGSFGAARTAEDFVRYGFSGDSSGLQVYYGPDAEILLDDRFSSLYCFHVMERDRARPNQVGLGFRPAELRGSRIDVDGALWIDTVARALVDIDYRYLGIDARMEPFQPGGHIAFRTMPNGVVVIDQWRIRIVGAKEETAERYVSPVRMGMRPGEALPADPNLYAAEVWGELARAEWPDGTRWKGPLGTLRLRAINQNGSPAVGAVVRLADTDYQATSDSAGRIEITDLLPGPYAVTLVDSVLAAFGVAVRTPVVFVAARDSIVEGRLDVRTTKDYVDDRCRPGGSRGRGSGPYGTASLLGRVTTLDGRPLPDARYSLHVFVGSSMTLGGRQPIVKDGEVGGDGIFQYCALRRGENVEVVVKRDGYADARVALTMTRPVMTVSVEMRPARR